MSWLVFAACLFAQSGDAEGAARAGESLAPIDRLRQVYQQDAQKFSFFDADQAALPLLGHPILRWSQDDDWSGDVFLWTSGGVPAVVGCLLSGPQPDGKRIFFDEFHLLAEKPIAPSDFPSGRRWQAAEGLKREPLPEAPAPAMSAAARLTQMRRFARDFTAHMEADGVWQLRLLPQPLYRYGDPAGPVADGALFAYVWTKGTDPEVILLLECRRTADGLAWFFAPVRFSSRGVWLRRDGAEVWRVESHREPAGSSTDQIYTSAYSRTASIDVDERKE
jgi:hypothetical protein